jgi:hypothetical protein
MMCRALGLAGLLAAASLQVGCATNAQRGMGIGGLGGAGVGSLIGKAAGARPEGMLIGAAAGALGGSLIGSAMDREEANVAAQRARQFSGAVTTADVVAMVQSGVGEEVIATHIRTNGVQQRIQAGDVITLRNQGVSDYLINTMQTASGVGPVAVAPQPVFAQPTYVVEQHYGPPVFVAPRRYWHRPYCPPAPGFSFQINGR